MLPSPWAPGETTEKPGAANALQELIDGFGDGVMVGHVGSTQPSPEPPREAAVQPTEQPADAPTEVADAGPEPFTARPDPSPAAAEEAASTPEQDGDGYGTADLFESFGLPQPDRVPGPVPQEAPEAVAEEPVGVSDEQMAVEAVQPEASPDGPNTASPPDDARERLTNADGRLAYTLWRPLTEDVSAEFTAGWQRTRDEFAAQVDAHDEQMSQSPQEQAGQLARWRRTFKRGFDCLPCPSARRRRA